MTRQARHLIVVGMTLLTLASCSNEQLDPSVVVEQPTAMEEGSLSTWGDTATYSDGSTMSIAEPVWKVGPNSGVLLMVAFTLTNNTAEPFETARPSSDGVLELGPLATIRGYVELDGATLAETVSLDDDAASFPNAIPPGSSGTVEKFYIIPNATNPGASLFAGWTHNDETVVFEGTLPSDRPELESDEQFRYGCEQGYIVEGC